MKKLIFVFLGMLLLANIKPIYAQNSVSDNSYLKLWYTRPASIWEEALPLGNGKTGAMVFGGIVTERYQLNDLTLWSGGPNDGNNPNGPEILKATREAVIQGDYAKAGETWKKIHGPYSARYLPMGDLFIRMKMKDTTVSNYYRDLNIQKAVASVRYQNAGNEYSRESFISFPDKVMVVNLKSNHKSTLSFDAWMTSLLHYKIEKKSDNYIVLKGKAPSHVANRDYEPVQIGYDEVNGEGTNFEIHLKVKTIGGSVKVENNRLVVTDADQVTLYLSDATSYNGFDKSPGTQGKDPSIEATANLNAACNKSFEQLKTTHIADFQHLFDRVNFDLGVDAQAAKLPTDERMLRLNNGKSDNQFQTLYYQYGRYLLISSSRDQKMPA
ncbi:MAG: glycoside hydrolase family 95 protein, partial [Bacteroidota bacterium]|nr:glycoside hydrolase family 95 protein [Bacteroidota bacterium]